MCVQHSKQLFKYPKNYNVYNTIHNLNYIDPILPIEYPIDQQSELPREAEAAQIVVATIIKVKAHEVGPGRGEARHEAAILELHIVALVVGVGVLDRLAVQEEPIQPDFDVDVVEFDVVVGDARLR